MKVSFLTQDAMDNLKINIKANIENYKKTSNEWIKEFFDGQSPFVEFKYDVPDFEMDMSKINSKDTDLENVKRVYINLKFLSESQASDERFWAGLTHYKFWSYMQYRWNKSDDESDEKKIKRVYFYDGGKRRGLAFNAIAKLWWIGRYTYDESLENPFKLTEYICNDIGTSTLYLFSSNFTSNDNVRLGMLKAIVDSEEKGIKIKRKEFKEIIKYLNIIGGTYLLDFFSEKEIYDMCIRRIEKM